MSSSLINSFFEAQSQYLSDVNGISYFDRATGEFNGWRDFSEMFCDNVVFWCTTAWLLARSPNEIGQYVGKIRSVFARYLHRIYFDVKYICSGHCPPDSYIPGSFHEIKFAQIGLDTAHRSRAYIAVKVSFTDLEFHTVIATLNMVQRELHDSLIVLHDIDITVDCALVSSRELITRYIHRHLGINLTDIVGDRHRVGDHCISWLCVSTGSDQLDLRIKIYKKFLQMLESTDARSMIGSQLSNFVANISDSFTRKLLQYRDTGMTRMEITLYGSKLYDPSEDEGLMNDLISKMSDCPTYELSFKNHWISIVERLQSMVALYDPQEKIFAYCHWWNSLTKRKQGLFRENIKDAYVISLLSNFGFNDRPIHYFQVSRVEDRYETSEYVEYRRTPGCTAITFVPGISNGLFPSRHAIRDRSVLAFPVMGLVSTGNVTIGWPETQLRPGQQVAEINTINGSEEGIEGTDEHERDSNDTLVRSLQINTRMYRADYEALESDTEYCVVTYGYAD